jgi:hypothetical protein
MRFLKHFFYGIFYLAILAGIGYLFYNAAFKPAPSCFDGIKNQNEEGVDCGGICANICLSPTLVSPNFSGEAKLFSLPTGLVSALYLIQNPNPDYAIKDFVYEFKIRDASGQIVKTMDGHSFIYAAEPKYIVAPAIDIGSATVATADFSATSTVWVRSENFAASNLEIQSSNISESSSSITITGRLINRDTTIFPSVLLLAVLTNNFGDQVGVGQTTLENLTPGETRNFTIIHPVLSDVNLPSTHIFPYALRP